MGLGRIAGARERAAWVIGFLAWGVALAGGFHQAMHWEFQPGRAGSNPTAQEASTGKPLLIVALHTQCPCSLATIDNLLTLTADERKKLDITLIYTGPDPKHSKILSKAASLAEAKTVFANEVAVLAKYGARTSGQAYLYSPTGDLIFSGGLTEARGVPGDAIGMSAIRNTLEGRPCPKQAPVYGCALQTPEGKL